MEAFYVCVLNVSIVCSKTRCCLCLMQATKGGKKSKAKAKLNAGKDTDRGDFDEVEYDDYEDFI